MTKDAEQATALAEQVTKRFGDSLDALTAREAEFSASSKKSAGAVKDASERIAQGIQRIEKAANFDQLERYVTLLERAAAAMESLAKLEETGRLEKLAAALR